MSLNLLINRSTTASLRASKNIPKCFYSSSKGGILGDLKVEDTPTYDTVPIYDEDKVEKLRNISRLNEEHRNILHGRRPYNESKARFHNELWYKRRMLGRYGIEASDVSPAIAWPTREEVEDKKEYERVAYPRTMQEILKEIEENKKEEALQIKAREEQIDKVVAQFDKWQTALQAKIAKKEAELEEAKKHKERAMQEIKEQFGFHIDTRDERFQELLAKKEKEDKKKRKEEKKKKKEQRLLSYMQKQEEEMKQRIEREKAETSMENKSESDLSKNDDKKDSKKVD